MRTTPKEKYGKLLYKLEVIDGDKERKHYQIREQRTYKAQIQRGRKPLIASTSLSLCHANKHMVKGGFKNIKEVTKYIVEEIGTIQKYNINFKGNIT